MKSLPISLAVANNLCLVVGGGDVAARKVELLLNAHANVTIVSPELNEALDDLSNHGSVSHHPRKFRDSDVAGNVLVIAATNDAAVNKRVSVVSRKCNIPVNVVDQPALCTFTIPSIVDRSPVTIAVSTGGASPVMARQLRARLETLIPSSYGRLADLVSEYRHEVKTAFADVDSRRRFWERVLQGHIGDLFISGREDAARRALSDAIQSAQPESHRGAVYLVGAGPGDPDLLTFRALRLMQQADVVLYDRLVSKEILGLTRRDARKLYVGKERSKHSLPQIKINEKLIELAKDGHRVLRLKGGDPFIFGRGGEEIGELARHNIPFEVVPGITAAAGCASYAGIPLTHRDYAQSCVFVTGHLKDGSVDLNWEQLSQPMQTVVIYMGLVGLPTICRKLIQHGVEETMPIALIEQGTTRRQRVFTGTLAGLPETIEHEDVHAPTLLIIGEVVSLRESLSWFNPKLV